LSNANLVLNILIIKILHVDLTDHKSTKRCMAKLRIDNIKLAFFLPFYKYSVIFFNKKMIS